MEIRQKKQPYEGPVHVIVHMGFHKTGTTSLQAYLKTYRKELKKQYNVFYLVRWRIREVLHSGRIYGQSPNLLTRLQFRRGLRRAFDGTPRRETIIISREGFSGIIPGHRRYGLWRSNRYGVVSRLLAREVVSGVKRHFGNDAKITLVYTLREQGAWIRSAWGHIMRTSYLKDDLDHFAKKMRKAPSLEEEVAKIAHMVAPVEVRSYYLEDTKNSAFGPAAAVLETAGVPESFGKSHPPLDVYYPADPPHLQAKFLHLNRNHKNNRALYDLKQELREAWLAGEEEPSRE